MDATLNLILQILEFIIAISILAFIHELGHYLTSKMFKIEVEEFGLGFPPRLARLFTWSGTEFTLNWIPFGAFVRPKGENDPEVPGGLASANPWARLVVLVGGPLMNLIAGFLIFNFIYTQTGILDLSRVEIVEVNPNSPAAAAGIRPEDVIIKINDQPVDSMETLVSLVHRDLGKEISISYQRGDQVLSTRAVPRDNPPEGEGALGIVMANPTIKVSWLQALPFSGRMMYEFGRQMFLMPAKLIQGQVPAQDARVVGPVGMFNMYQQVRQRDIQNEASESAPARSLYTLNLLAIISLALGITNLLPLPALDGGRIIFILPELILKKRVPAKYENAVHAIGFATLLALLAFVTLQDILNPIVLP